MPRRKINHLPTRYGRCAQCDKDNYDEISVQLALEYFSKHPKRGMVEPRRYYRCPGDPLRFHLTHLTLDEYQRQSA